MIDDLPEEVVTMIHELIAQGKSIEEIAFMMRLDEEAVREQVKLITTTPSGKKAPRAPRRSS